jgi:hypothetical protein
MQVNAWTKHGDRLKRKGGINHEKQVIQKARGFEILSDSTLQMIKNEHLTFGFRIRFEKKGVFKVRPHPSLLHLEKEYRKSIAGFAECFGD